MLDRQRVAIIGGGISGLAAAHRLRELDPSLELSLLESADRLGGVIRTETVGGFRLEHGPDSLLTQVPWGMCLCRRVGIADELIGTNPTHRGVYVVRRGRLRKVPDGLALMAPQRLWPIMLSPILSLSGKLRLASERFIPPRQQSSDESLTQFVTRRLGREVFERLVQPLVSGIYMGSPDCLSVRATFPRFVEMETKYGSLIRGIQAEGASNGIQRRTGSTQHQAGGPCYGMFAAPQQGLGRLVEAVAAKLPPGSIHLKTHVLEMKHLADGRWQIVTRSAGGEPEPETFDAVVVATSASRLLHDAVPPLAAELATIEHTSCIVVNMAFARDQIRHPLDAYGFVTPHIETPSVLACTFSSVKYAHRAPQFKLLLRAYLGGGAHPEVMDWSDGKIKEAVLKDLHGLLDTHGEPLFFKVQRCQRTMPQYELGHLDRVGRIERIVNHVPGLALAGNAYHGVGVAHCIHSGEAAALHVHKQLHDQRRLVAIAN